MLSWDLVKQRRSPALPPVPHVEPRPRGGGDTGAGPAASAVLGSRDTEAVSWFTPCRVPWTTVGVQLCVVPAARPSGVCVTAVALKLMTWEVSRHCARLHVLRWASFTSAFTSYDEVCVGGVSAAGGRSGSFRKCCLRAPHEPVQTHRRCLQWRRSHSPGGTCLQLSHIGPHASSPPWGSLPETEC